MDDLRALNTMGQALVERGLASPEAVASEIAQARAERGLDPLPTQGGQQAGALPGTPEVDPLDALAFAAPENPAHYRFEVPDDATPEQEAQVAQVRAVFHGAGIPISIASEVDRQYSAAMANPPSAAQLEAMRQEGSRQLHRMHGDDAEKVLAVARREFNAMVDKMPMLRDMATHSGIGNSAWLVTSLYNNARAKGRG